MADQLLQQQDIVVRARDMVTSAEVQPLHSIEVFAELLLHSFKRCCECVRPLLAERMEVQPVESRKQILPKVCNLHPETRTGCTRVIDRMFLRRTLRVDPHAAGRTCRTRRRTEALPLGKGVEDNVVADRSELYNLLFLIGGLKDVVLPAHLLLRKASLVNAARRRAREIASDQRIVVIHGKTLLCEQHLCPRIFRDLSENFEILLQEFFVYEIGGRWNCVPLRTPLCICRHQSTNTGLWLSCHGSPHTFSASMNGSGSNSSTLNTPGRRHLPVITIIAPIIAGTPVV